MKVWERLEQIAIIPVATLTDPDDALRLGETLLAAGLPALEITFRAPAAAECLSAAASRFPQLLLGAGTVLTIEHLRAAQEAGAAFAVAPGFNPIVVDAARELAIPFVPGVSTPSEIDAALQKGCRTQKLFPAEALGGISYLKAVAAPYVHTGLRFVPTGGISPANFVTYLAEPAVVAVGGSWIAPPDLIAQGDWAAIAARASAAVDGLRRIRNPRIDA